MIWGRLKKSTKDADQEFAEMMEKEHVTFRERLLMTLTAYMVLLLPCILVLLVLSLIAMWMVGVL